MADNGRRERHISARDVRGAARSLVAAAEGGDLCRAQEPDSICLRDGTTSAAVHRSHGFGNRRRGHRQRGARAARMRLEAMRLHGVIMVMAP